MKIKIETKNRYAYGINLEYVTNWQVEPGFKKGSVEPLPTETAFFLRLYFVSGKEMLVSTSEGARELMEILNSEYFPIVTPEQRADIGDVNE